MYSLTRWQRELSHSNGARIVATYHPSAVLRADEADKVTLYGALCDDLALARRLAERDTDSGNVA